MTDPRCWNDLATENAALRAALDVARAEIALLASAVGGESLDDGQRDMLRKLSLSRVDRAARGEREGE